MMDKIYGIRTEVMTVDEARQWLTTLATNANTVDHEGAEHPLAAQARRCLNLILELNRGARQAPFD